MPTLHSGIAAAAASADPAEQANDNLEMDKERSTYVVTADGKFLSVEEGIWFTAGDR